MGISRLRLFELENGWSLNCSGKEGGRREDAMEVR